ncbi:hypothetical protein Scep_019686 [Stephania cephalantha]|uniref:HSF-type DNA-binding domain-containing protein n=1 Tax=Stephania cephalantha TaxID=152367 RepID=A0AAP0IBH1_9MAGN
MASHDQCEQESLIIRASKEAILTTTISTKNIHPATDGTISWNADGIAFVVWQPAEFWRDLLPTLFKHCNLIFKLCERELPSNIRRRSVGEKIIVSSPYYSSSIQARNAANEPAVLHEDEEDQGSSLASSSSEYSNMLDENKKLKRQYEALNSELKNMN